MARRNLSERFDSRFTIGESQYGSGRKYWRRYDVFCTIMACGLTLRASPTNKKTCLLWTMLNQHLLGQKLFIGEGALLLKMIQ
jgi:hypothetical protein